MQQENNWFEANRAGWELKTKYHTQSAFYDLENWKNGKISLNQIELQDLGNVAGKRMLHLQCHFGQDTLSWARLGARVTGCDFSTSAIKTAKQLSRETGLKGRFVCCNVYDLKTHLSGKYDIVFTSYGTIGWLPDLDQWAEIIAHFLKKNGVFYIADFHPVLWMLDDEMQYLKYPYHNSGVIETEHTGTYADREASIQYTEYGWNHSLSEIINSLLSKGLQLQFLKEYPYSPYNCFPNTVQGTDGFYRIKGLENIIPMVYSIKAIKR